MPPDTKRFSILRKLSFFTEFDDPELWEVLRLSAWRKVEANTTLMRQGDSDQRFGLVLEGSVELSVDGRQLTELGPGEPFGEIAYLDEIDRKQAHTVVSTCAMSYIEFNPSAMALATEECLEQFRKRLITVVARRLAEAGKQLSQDGGAARRGSGFASGFELNLVDD